MSTKAAGQPSKPAMVAPKAAPPKPNVGAIAAPPSSKMHKRSRSGCFTCRLRRKKCDEIKPFCRACKHLGVKCEYKRPLWWSNNEQRKQHKEAIKEIIKRTKLSEKNTKGTEGTGADTPPGLSHSLPTSATYSDPTGRTRATSEDSAYSFDFNTQPPLPQGHFDMYDPQVYTPGFDAPHAHYGAYPAPYEIDIQTESQMYVDGIPTRKDSSQSTFSTFQPPPSTLTDNQWPLEDIYEGSSDIFAEPTPKTREEEFAGYFDFQHPSVLNAQQAMVQVEENDRPLLEHFVDNVLRLIYPILESHRPGVARSEVVLPALESNKCYLHCCLSIAAIHLKSTLPAGSATAASHEQLDADIVRHRYATIAELCDALNRDTDHLQILEATLGMIFFQCSVGRADDSLPDIPWHQHFQAATSLVRKLDLPGMMQAQLAGPAPAHPPFNMTLTAWIDILGATMLGQAPQFAGHYREMHLSSGSSGLLELMGCEDRTMYLISEIACLEALKLQGNLDDTNLCSHIALLAGYIDGVEADPASLESAVSPANGKVRPNHLSRNMTALFQRAARIWLLSLIPGASRHNQAMLNLQHQFTELLALVPTGPGGFDRSIVWPLLMAGAQSTPDGPLRAALAERIQTMGPAADTGAFGRVRRVLDACWAQDALVGEGAVDWRDIMTQNNWDFLLL